MNYAKLGTVSHGTMNPEHLLRRLSAELKHQLDRNPQWCAEHPAVSRRLKELASVAEVVGSDNDDASETVSELFDLLDNFAPPYTSFCSHPGDGSDFGYWPHDIESIKEDIDFSSSAEAEYPPTDFAGEWLHINERGNCTLYTRSEAGRDTELWSLV